MGSTAKRANSAGGADCGFGGGNAAPDRVYEYVAPATGIYDFAIEDAGFAPLLYLRRDDCLPGSAQLGCNVDDDGDQAARIDGIELEQGDTVAIIVDGEEPRGDRSASA
jgi:hypothetical protein